MPDEELVLAIVLGIAFWTIVLLIIAKALGLLAGRTARSPFLALSLFNVDAEQGRLAIVGRRAGLLNWISTRLRVGSETSLRVSQGLIHLETNGLFSFHEVRVPLHAPPSAAAGSAIQDPLTHVSESCLLAAVSLEFRPFRPARGRGIGRDSQN